MRTFTIFALILLAFAGGFLVAKANLPHHSPNKLPKVPGSINVDLNADGINELVYIDAPQEANALDSNTSNSRVWYTDSNVVRVIHETSAGLNLQLDAKDLNGDGKPDILVYEWDPNSNALIKSIYLYSWNGKGFVNLVANKPRCLNCSLESGSLIVHPQGKQKPSVLITYGWDDTAPNYSAHQYYATYYEFRRGRFVETKTRHTRAAYSDKTQALKELGL